MSGIPPPVAVAARVAALEAPLTPLPPPQPPRAAQEGPVPVRSMASALSKASAEREAFARRYSRRTTPVRVPRWRVKIGGEMEMMASPVTPGAASVHSGTEMVTSPVTPAAAEEMCEFDGIAIDDDDNEEGDGGGTISSMLVQAGRGVACPAKRTASDEAAKVMPKSSVPRSQTQLPKREVLCSYTGSPPKPALASAPEAVPPVAEVAAQQMSAAPMPPPLQTAASPALRAPALRKSASPTLRAGASLPPPRASASLPKSKARAKASGGTPAIPRTPSVTRPTSGGIPGMPRAASVTVLSDERTHAPRSSAGAPSTQRTLGVPGGARARLHLQKSVSVFGTGMARRGARKAPVAPAEPQSQYLDLAAEARPRRVPLTVPSPFRFAGDKFHEKAQSDIERMRKEQDAVENRRTFKSRAMPDFKALHAAADKNKGRPRRPPAIPRADPSLK